jgi:vitamin B12 transporter
VIDLLSRQSGIQVATSGGPGTTASLYMRGARPDQTKILVDGLPINSIDLAGSPLRYIPLANVERIEILRGPGSTMYGADAIGGVIQIFTRQGTPGLKADGFIGYGTQNTFQANAGVSGGNEQWRFRLEANQASTDSISAQKNATNRDADKDPYRNTGGAASVSFLPAQGHEVGFIYRQNEGRTHYDSGMSRRTAPLMITSISAQSNGSFSPAIASRKTGPASSSMANDRLAKELCILAPQGSV